jgi:hypothetical protein
VVGPSPLLPSEGSPEPESTGPSSEPDEPSEPDVVEAEPTDVMSVMPTVTNGLSSSMVAVQAAQATQTPSQQRGRRRVNTPIPSAFEALT